MLLFFHVLIEVLSVAFVEAVKFKKTSFLSLCYFWLLSFECLNSTKQFARSHIVHSFYHFCHSWVAFSYWQFVRPVSPKWYVRFFVCYNFFRQVSVLVECFVDFIPILWHKLYELSIGFVILRQLVFSYFTSSPSLVKWMI